MARFVTVLALLLVAGLGSLNSAMLWGHFNSSWGYGGNVHLQPTGDDNAGAH